MNKDNLVVPSSSQAREYGRKGGKARAKKAAEKKEEENRRRSFAEDAIIILNKKMKDGDKTDVGDIDTLSKDNLEEANLSVQQKMLIKMINEALKGNVKAFETIMKLTGELVDKHQIDANITKTDDMKIERLIRKIEKNPELKDDIFNDG